jgi:peptidoglycan LD-endopeptidase LytH
MPPAGTSRRVALLGGVVVLVAASLTGSAAADTRQDLEAAQAQVAALRARADEASVAYQDAYAQLSETGDAIVEQEAALAATEARLAELQVRATERALTAYMGGSSADPFGVEADSALDAGRREALLNTVAADDVDFVETLDATREDLGRIADQLADLRSDQSGLVAAMEAASQAALADLAEAQELEASLEQQYAAELAEQRRREEEARRQREAEEAARRAAEEAARRAATTTTAPVPTTTVTPATDDAGVPIPTSAPPATTAPPTTAPPPSGGAIPSGYACPVPLSSFSDSWGAARGGGRRHEGVDMMAPFGTPNYAVIGGTVTAASSSLGGISLYLRGDDGNRYYYAHLQAITKTGRVEQGDQIGEGGASGNASSSAPHTHFEVHLGGTNVVNPYPYVRQWC